MYGNLGDPLPWSSRTRTLKYKYDPSNPNSKHKLSKRLEDILLTNIREKVGVLPENIDLDVDHLNAEREKRLLSAISKEVINLIKKVAADCEDGWKSYELEETQVKLELSEMVLEQLLNEVVEIMEHVQLSRINPMLYHNKSIYACEEIPRLSFQNNSNLELNDEVNQ